MVKRIHVEARLAPAELGRRYRAARDPVERTHYQIVWLLAQGRATREVMVATGYSRRWVQEVARRYNRAGPAGLGDRRRANPGGEALLDAAGCEALRAALGGGAPDGGVWSGPKVARWMGERLGRRVHARRGWDYLRRLRYSPHMPRPAHAEADPEEQARFPKG
jgi:transposase